MSDATNSHDPPEGDSEKFLAFQKKAKAANLNEQTLLATDYLNHFNEIVMTIEMIPDMPELLEEAREWRPKSYQDHFRDSTFAGKDMAIEAYEYVPARYRTPFEANIAAINRFIAMTVKNAEDAVASGDNDRLRLLMTDASHSIQKIMDMASANIHGSEHALDQAEVDALLGV
ncbi:MAG: hypothetical protein A3G18_03395 [Rhodospirillales bacterium RIFCSPLOWO2_12_FULL_58_28]|nr:MAG: hypothetical protein A3H92_03340 [Rhodospirillales bacterium RIFCSPLOWO2_02_FULL_58_16]OHC77322.1 MAG: hypothetical protein A3G18_03395 [Rhodospirillales bacterium RIFCSPLOWO2_12_FULL_58_28]